MLERYISPEELNIKDLTVELTSTESKPSFITKSDLTGIDHELTKCRETRNWVSFSDNAALLKQLGDNPILSEKDWEEMNKALNEKRDRKEWVTFSEIAKDIQTLGRKPEIEKGDWQKMAKYIDAGRGDEQLDWVEFVMLAANLERLGQPVLNEEDRDRIANSFEQERENFDNEDEWQVFASRADDLRIIGRKPELSSGDWSSMYATLEKFRQNTDWNSLANVALAMSNLAITEKTSSSEPTLTLPEERTF